MSHATVTAMDPEEIDAIGAYLSPAEVSRLRPEPETDGGRERRARLDAHDDPTAVVRRAYAESASARRAIEELGERVGAFQAALGVPRKERVYEFLSGIDTRSRGLVEYCWLNGHAPITELRAATTTETDMAILTAIRERIDPVAKRTLDRPVLTFEERKVDPRTGAVVTFEWWFTGDAADSSSVPMEVETE